VPLLRKPSSSYYRARYYDPAIGRFLREDEVGNDEGVDLYAYTRNNPINFGDPTGLYRLIGFSPGDAQRMRAAIKSAIDVTNESKCSGCAGSFGPQIAHKLESATFVYTPNLKNTSGQALCGDAKPLNTNRISVGISAFGKSCCRLDATLAHEAMHKVAGPYEYGWQNNLSGEPGPREMEEKCFGCSY
jgi:uncharacterized protein RhaS with RHS repeats